MGMLDKFNDWYVRAIPESETGTVITWLEPAAGARERWKKQWPKMFLWLPVVFLLALVLPSRHQYQQSDAPFEQRFWITLAVTSFIGLMVWFFGGVRQPIVLSAQRVIIGQGRGRRRIDLAGVGLTLETRDGYPVLILSDPDEGTERIYLESEKEAEVRALLAQAGHLKS